MSSESQERVVVTLDDQHLASIDSVVSALKSAGLQVHNVMSTVGIVSGEVPADKVHSLRQVSGVVSVEPDEEMRAI